jgi:protein-disulfide isomerase
MKLLVCALAALLPVFAAAPDVNKGKAYGGANAPLTVELFTCFTCPHCKIFHEQIVPQIMRDYVVSGKVYLVNRDFPLNHPDHRHCRDAHVYADAASRIGKYQQVANALWAKQASWSKSGDIWGTISPVLSADEQKKVQALAKDPGVAAEVQREFEYGTASGVGGTPALIVIKGGRRIPVPRVDNYNLLKSLLDDLLK